ncbi:MAG: hypothetical protein ACOYMN_08730 [Roseimicrobium sp.]
MSQLLFIVGLLIFAYACRTFQSRYVNKLGWLAVLAATYLSAFFLTGSHAWGWAAIGAWFVLPWVEILGRVRKLRFPLRSEVKHRFPPSREVFPDLSEITSEVEESGFEQADDAGWKWEETDHFVRIFYHKEKRLQANVSVALQEEFVFSHASLTTRTTDGVTYVTTNYPFSFTMKLAPQQRLQRCDDAECFDDLIVSHAGFLAKNGITPEKIAEQDPEELHSTIATDLSEQIDHNLSAGVIVQADEKHFRYSWRGCFYLWCQVVKDMIRV